MANRKALEFCNTNNIDGVTESDEDDESEVEEDDDDEKEEDFDFVGKGRFKSGMDSGDTNTFSKRVFIECHEIQ